MEGAALPTLHALQEEFGYVPKQSETLIADALNVSHAEIHGVISFYHDDDEDSEVVRRSQETFRTSADAWAAGMVVLQTPD